MTKLYFGSAKRALTIGAFATLTGYSIPSAQATPVVEITFAQNGGASELYVDITNTDFTYDSATVQFDSLFNPIAQFIQNNNPDYSTQSLDEIKSGWAYTVSSDGEVYTGWSANETGGLLDLSHMFGRENDDYTVWNSTSENPAQDRLRFVINFFDQLDINHNSQFDSELEQLTWDGPLVNGAVTGIHDIDNTYSTDVNQVGVVPEPATMTMLGLAGLLIAAKRRFFS